MEGVEGRGRADQGERRVGQWGLGGKWSSRCGGALAASTRTSEGRRFVGPVVTAGRLEPSSSRSSGSNRPCLQGGTWSRGRRWLVVRGMVLGMGEVGGMASSEGEGLSGKAEQRRLSLEGGRATMQVHAPRLQVENDTNSSARTYIQGRGCSGMGTDLRVRGTGGRTRLEGESLTGVWGRLGSWMGAVAKAGQAEVLNQGKGQMRKRAGCRAWIKINGSGSGRERGGRQRQRRGVRLGRKLTRKEMQRRKGKAEIRRTTRRKKNQSDHTNLPPSPGSCASSRPSSSRGGLKSCGRTEPALSFCRRRKKRLEDAKKLVRDAGGPTERRLVFSILQEETREFKLREAIPRAEKKVRDMESNLREAQKELEAARRKQTALEALWRNSKARIAFLASEKAAETVSQEQTTAVHEALQRILATTSPALQAQARMVSEYFRAVAPIQARATEERFYDLSDGVTQDEAQAMEEITEQQRQGVKRQLEEDAKGGGGALPLPVRDTASLEDAKVELARLRHQKLAAISAAFDRKGEGSEVVPTMSPSELSDRFDHELQRAMEQVRRCEAAQAEAADPTPTPLVPASSPGVQGEGGGGEGTVGGEGGEASQGEEGGRKMAKTSTAGNSGEAGDEGGTGASVEQRVLGSRQPNTGEGGDAGPASTRWEQGNGHATGEVGVRGLGPHVELECPGCGRGPIAPQALTGSCECGAAVCMECGEGGIQINNCLLCFEDWTNGQGDIQAEATPVPGPRAFAGTLSSDLQDEVQARSTASRRAAPYAR